MGEKDLQALLLLLLLSGTDGALRAALTQQLPPFSNRKVRCCTIKLLRNKFCCLVNGRLWDNWQLLNP